MIPGVRVVFIAAAAAFVIACSTAPRKDRAGAQESEAHDENTPAPPAEIAILDLYEPIALYEVLPLHTSRADYSGLTIRSADTNHVTVWIVNDKATRVEDAIYSLSVDFPPAMSAEPIPVTPVRLPVANPKHLPTGEDIEDIGWVQPAPNVPGVAVVSGERGPGDRPVSWTYLMLERGDSLELIRSEQGSPPGETVGNDGFEGAAVRRLADGRIETFYCKERPAPTYIVRERFAWNGTDYALTDGPDFLTLPVMGSQSAACIAGAGNLLCVVDRGERRIAVVDISGDDLRAAGGNLDGLVRRWIRYAAVDRRLEGRSEDAPVSLYGAVEAISEDELGRLYLMTDNNEAGNSRLMVLRRK